MSRRWWLLAAVAFLNLATAASGQSPAEHAANVAESKVTAIPDEVIKRYKLDTDFYKKHLDYKGFSILSSAKVSDEALYEARYLIHSLLGKREDVLQAMIKAGCRFMVMAPAEMTTDVPEQRHLKNDPKTNWDKRARGLGGKLSSCGEENLLNLKGDRYRQENILIHEFNHAIHQQGLRSVDPTFQGRLRKAYDSAMESGLWKGTYVATNPAEYWAEGAQAYFDCMRPQFGANTREKLQKYDPGLFALVDEVYRQSKFRYVRYDQRKQEPAGPKKANPGEPVRWRGQNAELSIAEISSDTVQVLLAPLDEAGKPRVGRASTALVEQKPIVKLRLRHLDKPQEVQAGKLRVTVKRGPLTITIRDGAGKVVQELAVAEAEGSLAFRTAAPVLGLGEGDRQFDRRGARYPMVNGQVAPWLATHGGTIRVPFLIGAEGWAMFLHRPTGDFDLRDGAGRFVPSKDAGSEPLEVYVTHVSEPHVALAEYIRLTGRPALPPKWVLGYMQSHRTLAGPEEPSEIARTFRDKKLPCDALIYLGTGYCPAGWNVGHGTLDFNPRTFDQPAANLKALRDLDFKLVLHINKAPRNLFGASVREKSDAPLHISNYWARHKEVFGLGIAGWWPDDGDELPVDARLARHRCYYEGPLLERPNERPWSMHRNGYAGAPRYGGWIWSGDVQSRWATLAAHVPVGVNTSLSLTPFWGTDTGGFVPTKELTGELYVRWFQFSAFNPLFRSHGRTWKLRLPWGWNTGEFGPVEAKFGPDKSELHNADVEPICRKYLELRYRLLPYNYTLLREACDTGLPPMRALWLHHPDDAEAVKLGDQYLWGRDLLVAPVVEKGASVRAVYLPAGTWYDWWTGAKVEGARWIKRPVDLATMPIYVRAGAIVPLDPLRQHTAQAVTEPTTLQIHRGADGQFVLYDDDGKSLDYLKGQGVWTRLTWSDGKRTLVIEPDARTAPQAGPEITFDVLVLPDKAQKRVQYTGKRVEVAF